MKIQKIVVWGTKPLLEKGKICEDFKALLSNYSVEICCEKKQISRLVSEYPKAAFRSIEHMPKANEGDVLITSDFNALLQALDNGFAVIYKATKLERDALLVEDPLKKLLLTTAAMHTRYLGAEKIFQAPTCGSIQAALLGSPKKQTLHEKNQANNAGLDRAEKRDHSIERHFKLSRPQVVGTGYLTA